MVINTKLCYLMLKFSKFEQKPNAVFLIISQNWNAPNKLLIRWNDKVNSKYHCV